MGNVYCSSLRAIGWRPSVADWGDDMSASCKPRVQLFADSGNRWLRYYYLMPISCHFRQCKALLVTSLTCVKSAIASTRAFTFPLTLNQLELFDPAVTPAWVRLHQNTPACLTPVYAQPPICPRLHCTARRMARCLQQSRDRRWRFHCCDADLRKRQRKVSRDRHRR